MFAINLVHFDYLVINEDMYTCTGIICIILTNNSYQTGPSWQGPNGLLSNCNLFITVQRVINSYLFHAFHKPNSQYFIMMSISLEAQF